MDPMSGRLRLRNLGSERISAGDEAATGASGTLSLLPQGKAGLRSSLRYWWSDDRSCNPTLT